jgi:tetratricopeptide (TPR) repeat protein
MLSGVLYFGSALLYLEFDRTRNRAAYAKALIMFGLGLLAKTVIASLPGALLVIFWWKRGRLSWKQDVKPLVPFFVVALAAGLLTSWVEKKFIHAVGPDYDFTLMERGLIAGRAIWVYLGRLFWPADLIFIYPRWEVSQNAGWQYLFPGAVMLALAALCWLSRWWRGPLAGFLFFIGTLFPVLGFFNVYPFRYSFVADHFQYLACIGPLTLAGVGITRLIGLFEQRKPWLKPLVYGTLLTTLGVLTWLQSQMYADNEKLWSTTIARNPGCWMAYNNLGVALEQTGRTPEAIALYEEALKLKPDFPEARKNLNFAQASLKPAPTSK